MLVRYEIGHGSSVRDEVLGASVAAGAVTAVLTFGLVEAVVRLLAWSRRRRFAAAGLLAVLAMPIGSVANWTSEVRTPEIIRTAPMSKSHSARPPHLATSDPILRSNRSQPGHRSPEPRVRAPRAE
jgi:uncharacterized protein (DUF2062 family)